MAKKGPSIDKGMMISMLANFAAALAFVVAGLISPTNKIWYFVAGGVLVCAGIALTLVMKNLKKKLNLK